jgi:hypothetical protein
MTPQAQSVETFDEKYCLETQEVNELTLVELAMMAGGAGTLNFD